MICEVNSRGVLTFANKYAFNKFGYSPEIIKSARFSILNIFPDNLRQTIAERIEAIYQFGGTQSGEYLAVKSNGETFPVLTHISPIEENGIIIGIRGVMIDITDRKKQETEIARNLKQQEILSEISLNYNSLEDFEKMTNKTLQIIGQHTQVSRVYIFEDSEDGKYTSNTFEWCNEGISPQISELQNIPYSMIPSWRYLLETKGMVFSENIDELPADIYEILEPQGIKSIIIYPLIESQKIIGFVGFDECNSLRKWSRSETELLKTITNIISNAFQKHKIQFDLINSELENRIIINSIPDLILQIDEKGVIKSFKSANQINPFLLLNADKNNSIDSVFIKPAAKSFSNAIKKCLTTGSHQFDFQHLDGENLQYFEARLIRLNQKEALVMIRDVTTLREYEKQLLIAKTKAEEASKSKSEFLANVSHEIRTPLNAILGLSQWLAENTTVKQHHDYLNTILISGKNLLNLLNDILDLSKIESGKMDIEMQPMSYRELINDIKMVFQQKTEQKGISFQIITDQSVPEYIYMDELRFYQIIFNLVSNAIKFTAKGFINISAYGIKTADDKSIKLVIVVEDSGIGIEPAQQEKIFESFTQQSGQNNRQYGGTGLGLAIVKGLLDKLNGSISLKSKPGKGSSFTITFNHVRIDYFSRTSNVQEKEELIKVLEPCKIMIVDDINFNILVLKKLINGTNVTFIEANDGTEALAKLETEIPDLIFMDIRMPGMNGFEVTEYIKSKPELALIPVIAFTASVAREPNDRIDKLFDGYLQKPVFKKDIDNLLFKFLQFSQQTQIAQNEIQEISDDENTPINELVVPELIVEIETKYQHKWENIKDNLVIYEIEEFKNQLAELAFQYSCKFITQYCNELDMGLQSFDIEMIESKLNEFPKLVEQLASAVRR